MKKNNKGAVDPVSLILIVLVSALLIPSFKLPSFLQKQPPVAQLTIAQVELSKAREAQALAEKNLADVKAKQDQRTTEQLAYGQQMSGGVSLALDKVPAEHQTPEVKLAAELSNRANDALEAANGKLSPQARAEISALIDNALSAKNSEVATLRAALADKDSALQASVKEKTALAAELPGLKSAVAVATADRAVSEAKVEAKTKEISVWAEAKAAADRKAGSLDAYAGTLLRILIGLVVFYMLVHFVLPSLAQEFPASKVLQWFDKTAKSVSSSHV